MVTSAYALKWGSDFIFGDDLHPRCEGCVGGKQTDLSLTLKVFCLAVPGRAPTVCWVFHHLNGGVFFSLGMTFPLLRPLWLLSPLLWSSPTLCWSCNSPWKQTWTTLPPLVAPPWPVLCCILSSPGASPTGLVAAGATGAHSLLSPCSFHACPGPPRLGILWLVEPEAGASLSRPAFPPLLLTSQVPVSPAWSPSCHGQVDAPLNPPSRIC